MTGSDWLHGPGRATSSEAAVVMCVIESGDMGQGSGSGDREMEADA